MFDIYLKFAVGNLNREATSTKGRKSGSRLATSSTFAAGELSNIVGWSDRASGTCKKSVRYQQYKGLNGV